VGIIVNPRERPLEYFADASFGGDWHKATAAYDKATAKSRTVFVIFYCGCPITWESKFANRDSILNNRGRIHCAQHHIARSHPADGFDSGNKVTWL
jgi:hypothetical protein